MESLSFAFYCAAGLADVCALALLVRSVPERMRTLRQPLPPEPELPMAYNESLTAIQQILAARTPAMVDASVRRGFNELIAAVQAEAAVREAADRRLDRLSDIPRHRRDLLLTVMLVALGALLGTAGNLASALN